VLRPRSRQRPNQTPYSCPRAPKSAYSRSKVTQRWPLPPATMPQTPASHRPTPRTQANHHAPKRESRRATTKPQPLRPAQPPRPAKPDPLRQAQPPRPAKRDRCAQRNHRMHRSVTGRAQRNHRNAGLPGARPPEQT
jgi:hypothetical protein